MNLMKKGGVKRGDFKMLNTYNTCNLYLSVQSFDTKFVYEKPRNNKMYPRLKTKLSVSPILACTKVNFDLPVRGLFELVRRYPEQSFTASTRRHHYK